MCKIRIFVFNDKTHCIFSFLMFQNRKKIGENQNNSQNKDSDLFPKTLFQLFDLKFLLAVDETEENLEKVWPFISPFFLLFSLFFLLYLVSAVFHFLSSSFSFFSFTLASTLFFAFLPFSLSLFCLPYRLFSYLSSVYSSPFLFVCFRPFFLLFFKANVSSASVYLPELIDENGKEILKEEFNALNLRIHLANDAVAIQKTAVKAKVRKRKRKRKKREKRRKK